MRFNTVLDTKMNSLKMRKKWLLQLVLHLFESAKKWLLQLVLHLFESAKKWLLCFYLNKLFNKPYESINQSTSQYYRRKVYGYCQNAL
jgi:hypothetical protein